MAGDHASTCSINGASTSASLHVVLPSSAETFLKLLMGAASPCALVSLGLFLAEKRPAEPGASGISLLLSAVKLIGQPALTW